jgi:uncharacterized membrane protein YdjX (TVP38/TMEM64 family)
MTAGPPPVDPPDPRRARLLLAAKIGAVLLVAAGLLVAHRFGVFHRFADPAGLKLHLLELRGWGYLTFILAYAALQPFGVPGTVFILAAPLIWPWPVAFALSMAGTMAASIIGFSFARFIARDFVSARIPARFRKYDEALARRGFTTVFLLRFVFWMPPLLHAFFGVSKVSFWKHFWGSLAGYALPLLAVSYFGEKAFDLMRNAPLWAWIALGAGLGLAGLAFWIVQRRRARAARARAPASPGRPDPDAAEPLP